MGRAQGLKDSFADVLGAKRGLNPGQEVDSTAPLRPATTVFAADCHEQEAAERRLTLVSYMEAENEVQTVAEIITSLTIYESPASEDSTLAQQMKHEEETCQKDFEYLTLQGLIIREAVASHHGSIYSLVPLEEWPEEQRETFLTWNAKTQPW